MEYFNFNHLTVLFIIRGDAQQAPSQYYSTAPSPTATLGQAYQQQPNIRAFQPAAPAYTSQTPQFAQPSPNQYSAPQAPMSYGWQVQHDSPQPQARTLSQPESTPRIMQQYASTLSGPQQAQYGQSPSLTAVAQAQYAAPVTVTAAPVNPYQTAQPSPLYRPASVHYASIGENLSGDYKFGYRTGDGNSFREESRLPDGTVQGQYGFVDADGKQRVVKYTAGIGGFQVLSGDGASPVQTSQAVPAARSALSTAVPVSIPQWAQGHLGAPVPSAPQLQAPANQVLARQYTQEATPIATAQHQPSQAWGTYLG